MKRVLVVALLAFLAGLALLLWFERTSIDVQPLPEPIAQGPSPEASTGEVVLVPDRKGQVTQIQSSGPLSVTDVHPETAARRYLLTARDHRSVGGGAVDATDLEVFLYAPDGVTLLRSLRAKSGRLQLDFEDNGRPRISDSVPATFQQVVVRAETGLQFAPVEVAVPEIEVLFGSRTLKSDRDVVVTGRGLQADGSGLFADALTGLMRIERQPVVIFELADGTQARLEAAGPLMFQNRPDRGPEWVEVRAAGGARLVLMSNDPVEVEASEVRLFGVLREADDRFLPRLVEAEGQVVLRRGESTFWGDRGEVSFGNDGRPDHGELRGSPRATVLMRGVAFEGRERIQDPDASLAVEGRGHDVLTFELGASSSFVLDGPAQVRLPSVDTTLDAQGAIRGGREATGGYDTVTAEGGVVVTSTNETLEAETVDVEAVAGQDGQVFARVTTHGHTHAAGTLEDGLTQFDLIARRGLVYVRHGDQFSVPRAAGVELTVTGPDGFRAGAEELRDLDGLARTFEAEGNVWFENELGRGTGERLIARGERQAEIFGAPTRPAEFAMADGQLRAQRIQLEGARLFAEGAVHATFERDGRRTELDARWVDVDQGRVEGEGLEGSDWQLDAGGEVRASVVSLLERHDLTSDLLRLRANNSQKSAPQDDDRPTRLEPLSLEAIGNVVADYIGAYAAHAEGQRLFLDAGGNAQLTPAPTERVRVVADDLVRGLHLELDAESVDYGLERMVAVRPDLTVDGLDLPVLGTSVAGDTPRLHAVAGRMALDRRSMLLSEGGYVARVSPLAEGWSLDADQILLTGNTGGARQADAQPPEAGALPLDGPFEELYAWGGFVASGSQALQARGERLAVSTIDDRIMITGFPASVLGNGVTWYSDWFELDGTSRSIRSAAGEMHTEGSGPGGPWIVRYASMEPIEADDTTIQVLREPVLKGAEEELRAAWALFWVDSRRWRRLSGGEPDAPGAVTGERRVGARMNSLFGEVAALGDIEWLREFYMEGNVEYIVRGDTRARAEAIYLDLVDGQGWVRKAEIETDMPMNGGRTQVEVRADWMRHSADGAYRAENAIATTCKFEEPHYVVRIGDFAMRPRARKVHENTQPASEGADESTPPAAPTEVFDGWDVEAKSNRLVLWRGLAIPLPKVGFPVGPDYKVEADEVSVFGMRPLSFGQDAKFGAFIGTSFALNLGWLLRWTNRLLGKPEGAPESIRGGNGDLHVRWLNKRGLLLGIDIPFYEPGKFYLDTSFSGILDTGPDKGLVRVPQDERSIYRGWYHARGRYLLGEREWVDGVYTYQTDPGFQAEFFEGQYLSYEERESYLHWRRAKGNQYVGVTLEAQLSNFHTAVIDQPSALALDGRSQVASIGEVPVYYGSRTTVGRFVRLQDQTGHEPPFPDGLGERTVSRFDTIQRIETPVDLGFGGLRATPYLDGRLTAWDEGADPDVSPLRTGLLAGFELATTFFKDYVGGAHHALSPAVGVRTDIAASEDNVALVPLDTTEIALGGTFVDVGLRSRWTYSERRDALDLELRATHVQDSPTFTENGWAPLLTRGTWLSSAWGLPYVLSVDFRFDPDEDLTTYSQTLLGFEPIPSVDVELGHHFARDPSTDVALFDATSVGLRYNFSEKWIIEGRQTVSSLGDGRLASGLGIRRIGHDFVVELETQFIAGEGQSVGIRLTPLLTWRKSGFSMLDNARRNSY